MFSGSQRPHYWYVVGHSDRRFVCIVIADSPNLLNLATPEAATLSGLVALYPR